MAADVTHLKKIIKSPKKTLKNRNFGIIPWIGIIGKNVQLILFDLVFDEERTFLLIECNNS